MLRVTRQAADPAGEIASLIHDSFAASEGPAEGARVGRLAAALLAGPAPPAKAFLAREGDALVGAVLFSPLAFSDDPRRVLLLSPMAVMTGRQGERIGQRLLGEALARLDAEGVDAVLTYGDPAFYRRLGFRPLDPRETSPPFPLSMPQGWLGRPPGARRRAHFRSCGARAAAPRRSPIPRSGRAPRRGIGAAPRGGLRRGIGQSAVPAVSADGQARLARRPLTPWP